MSEYNKTILTNAGIDLARRANKGAATFQLTRGVSSTENLSEKTIEELQNLTQLPSIQQSVSLSDVVDTTDNPDTVLGIRMTFDNQNLNTGYNVHTVGVYAKEPGKGEILYGVATAKTPEYIPDFREQMLFKFDFLMYLVIGRTDKVTVQVSPDDVYLKKDTYNKAEIDAKVSDAVSKLNDKDAEILKNLNDYKQENKTYHQNLEQQLDTKADKSAVNQQLETKADKSTTYTKDEVDNIISPKADKSYVDGELSKKADKDTTYTKDEVNSKIAGQVKSVNGHTANASGAVTLPTLKATMLTGYDVKNKTATFDNNAHFDANGIFSRRPVDQGVIGQLADAINAKLPIKAGQADADLLANSGNEIVYWNGNGDSVKNLPPMNNKSWFFAIKLLGPGWGSVTVVDQDGKYWLNNKTGDIWAGWQRIANIDEVNSRLSLGGGEMAKGSTILWQGTNAGPNIQEGNIGGLQWNGATDYVKIFGDNNSSDNLDLAIQLGDDNSNRISIRNALGTETAAILADGHYTGTVNWDCVNGRPDINNANPVVTVINSFDVANVKEGPHQTWPVKQPWLVDQMALHPFAEAINNLNTNLTTMRTELMNLKKRTDYNTPQGEFNNTTVNLNNLRSTGMYRLSNCYVQNGPYPTNNAHWIYVKVTVFDANTVYQTLYEGDNMYGRKASSTSAWGQWHEYLNRPI
ncbi:DUF4795 domain-containing protein [Lactobacillus gasseri]|uniref:DUF4795 domain-containing protein n=1 Tax=Lactobacillus gasseri TaxID=1596 RepID=UPI00118FB1AA|nr:DUF4795 domain-containing protein [Lactobacillus gasseri]MDK7168299.1 DUF4795 domain-containing protein [Lactobacillus gasseri]TVV24241.1 hypothetical protein FOF65_00045 [Lactobacillus gasseri]DAJ79381.1 MAG TPA: tail collar fiber protein [Caudoviricetes sp.]